MENPVHKALILGGGADQQKLVEEFNKRGYFTIIVDYYEDPPARAVANKHYIVSAYDTDKVLEIARNERVEYVTTISTDQPILVAAYVCEQLGLPFQVSYRQALSITNKMHMKGVFWENKIPTARFVILRKEADLSLVNQLQYPVIIKPVDSSGSRGVFIIREKNKLQDHYRESRGYSQTQTVIAEEFITGQEISVDAMVIDANVSVLSVTDGYKAYTENGTPLYNQNIFPSRISNEALAEVEKASSSIARAFGIKNSPLFIQMIVKEDEVFVIEFSARIAGGSKPYFIPYVSGVDIVSEYVSMLTGNKASVSIKKQNGIFILSHIYGREGIFRSFQGVEELISKNIMIDLIAYQTPGSKTRNASNGSDRLGAFMVQGFSLPEASKKVLIADEKLKVLDPAGDDLMLHGLFSPVSLIQDNEQL